MKKTKNFFKIIAIFCLGSILLVGCGSKLYDKSIEQGKLAVANQEYDKAQASFELALEEKDDEEARNMLLEVESFLAGLEAIESGDIDEALEYFKKIVQGEHALSAIVKESKEWIVELEEVKDQQITYEEQIAEVEALIKESDYQASEKILNELVEETNEKEHFEKIYKESKEMLGQVNLAREEAEKEKEKEAKLKEEKKKEVESRANNRIKSEVDEIVRSLDKGVLTYEDDKYIAGELSYQVNIVWMGGNRTRIYWIGSESLNVYDYDNNNRGSIYDFYEFESL